MDAKESREGAGKQWAEAHPAQADQVTTLLLGDFANRQCHKQTRPDDLICPACFQEFVTQVQVIDKGVGEEMEAEGLTWTRRWIEQLLA